MGSVIGSPLVCKGCRLTAAQLLAANEKVDVDASRAMVNDFLTSLVVRTGRVLALPMERVLVNPVVDVPMFVGLPSFAERDEEYVRLLLIQGHMP